MRTIDTAVKNNAIRFIFFPAVFLFLILTVGCAQSVDSGKAKEYTRQSAEYFERAVAEYKNLLGSQKDLDRLNFELGSLYYSRGKFAEALECLNKTNLKEAKKLLAISYYHLGNFTDALMAFSNQECGDDECRYYRALTSEKLNLFDQALKFYAQVRSDPEFKKLAAERINQIEKQAGSGQAKEIEVEVERLLSSAPMQEDFPEAGAIILSADEEIEVSKEGIQTSYMHYLIKILNERGKNEFAETQVGYDSTYEKVELEGARTISSDGRVTQVGGRHIRDVSRYTDFPLYSNARAFIISFPEVAEGAIIEYKVKVTNNQLINKKDFVVNYPLQTTEPVISAKFSVRFPKNTPPNLKIINDDYNTFGAELKPKIQDGAESCVYSWAFKNIPQIIPESNMPPGVLVNPTILMSTFNDWQAIYRWWRALSRDKIKADPAIKAKVRELTAETPDEKAKAAAIYNYCAKNIRYVAVEYGDAGYEPHAASDIFKNKYGDCKDQAVLLVTMLKEAGLDAWPVLIPTKADYNLSADFPTVQFNHCIAALSLNGQVIFMDPTASTCSFDDLPADDQERMVLVFQDEGYKIMETPMYPPRHNLIRQVLGLKMNEDGTISAHKDIYSSGMYDQAQRYWLTYTQPELIAQTIKEKVQDVSIGGRLIKYNIENLDDLNKSVVLSYDFIGPEYATIAGDLSILPQLASVDTSLVATDKRIYDIDLNVLESKDTDLYIDLPPGLKVKYLPPSLDEDSPWIKFSLDYGYHGNKIEFKQRSETKNHIIRKSEYAEFKRFFERIAKGAKQRIVLEKE
ncbi:MAG: DUF3857 domain-containing protein [Candidatus Omnitrophica bacterium]|nr:DUF3857 domain-containing protein [Candidatus Omnitrophota bacterium]